MNTLKILEAKLGTLFSKEEGHTQGQKIGRDFLPLVILLRLLGGYPIKIFPGRVKALGKSELPVAQEPEKVPKPDENENLYEHGTPKDGITWYSIFVSALLILTCMALAFSVGWSLETPWGTISELRKFRDENAEENYGLNNRKNQYLFAGQLVMDSLVIIAIWFGSSKFTIWLNGWNEFERLLFINTTKSLDIDHSRFKLYLVLYTTVGVLATICVIGLFNAEYYEVNMKLRVIGVTMNGVMTVAFMMTPLLEDVKTHYMLRMLRSAFQMVRKALTAVDHGCITLSTVEHGRKLANQVRRQTNLTGDCLTGWLSLSVLNGLISLACGAYMTLDFVRKGKSPFAQNGFLIITAIYCALPLVRLYFEILAAERVYDEERKLADDILEMRDVVAEPAIKSELQFWFQRLQLQPAKISVGNYFSLDKKLLIYVLVQVLTLLIAIMQIVD